MEGEVSYMIKLFIFLIVLFQVIIWMLSKAFISMEDAFRFQIENRFTLAIVLASILRVLQIFMVFYILFWWCFLK